MKSMLASMPTSAVRAHVGEGSPFKTAISESGAFRMETMRSVSATEAFSRAIQKQDVSMAQAIKNRKLFNSILREQYQLQRMTAVGITENGTGRMTAEMIVPRGAPERLNSMRGAFNAARTGAIGYREAIDITRMRVGLFSEILRANSTHMINWGKNTQWAGRQLMVGMTMPFAIFAGAAAAAAYSVDKEMTRVIKVYDSAGASLIKTDDQIKQSSMQTAETLAKNYGQTGTDTLKIMGDLASAGFKDIELQKATAAVSRARFLGELDLQDAINTTISLQTVFQQSSEDMTKTWSMMNAVENNTVLNMKDFSVMLPRIAGIIKELGGSVGDVAVLGAAMKAAGIDAAEGANALKSISFRVVAANGKALETFFSKTGQHLDQIVAKNDGKVIPSLIAMMKAMEPLDKMQRVSVVRDVFGIYQGSKALSIMQQLAGESEQVVRAQAEIGKGAEEWAATATREVQKFQESASGRFQRALANIKIQMAKLGEPLLKVATTILGFVSSFVGWFNELGSGTKQFWLMVAAIGAIAGPALMIAGIFGNLVGQFLKLGAVIGTGLTKFKLLSAEQRMQQMLSNQTALGWRDEATAAAVLSTQLNKLTGELRLLAVQSEMAKNAGMTGIGNAAAYGTAIPALKQNASGALVRQNGQFASSAERAAYTSQFTGPPTTARPNLVVSPGGGLMRPNGQIASQAEMAAFRSAEQSSTVIAQQSAVTESKWSKIGQHAQGLAVGAALVGSMATDSGTFANNLMIGVMTAGLIGPTLMSGIKKAAVFAKGTALWGTLSGATAGGGGFLSRPLTLAKTGVTKLGGSIKALLPAIMGFGAAFALVGAGIAFTVMQINKQVEQTKKRTKEADESAKAWGETLGFDYTEMVNATGKAGNAVNELDAKVKKFAETNKSAAAELSDFSSSSIDDKWARAIEEGLRVRLHGGGAKAAEEATQVALAIMGKRFKNAKDFEIQLKTRIDFGNMTEVIDQKVKNAQDTLNKASQNKFGIGNWEKFGRVFIPDETLNSASGEKARGAAKELWNIYEKASVDEQKATFDRIRAVAEDNLQSIFDKISGKDKAAWNKAGITNIDSLAKKYQKEGKNAFPLGIDLKDQKLLEAQLQTYRIIVQEKGKSLGLSEKELDNLWSFSQLQGRISPGLGSTEQKRKDAEKGERAYRLEIEKTMKSGQYLSQEEQLRILNVYRLAAGLEAATRVEQGFQDALLATGSAMAQDAYTMTQIMAVADEWSAARQDIMSKTMESAFTYADELMQNQQQDAIDEIGKKGEASLKNLANTTDAMEATFDKRRKTLDKKWDAQMDAFDKKWDARKDSEKALYDNRIDGIREAMDAEQSAEDQRQKMFEAEKTRVQRLSEMFSKNVDFNVALNSGNLDEAAKIANDMQSTQDSWATDEASNASQEASDKKRDDMDKQIKKIEKDRDARLKALDLMEEREKKALEDKKERELEALDAEKKRYQKGQDAAKDALQAKTKMEQDAAKDQYAANKRKMDLELLALKEFIPRDETEMKAHVKNIEAVYKKYGINLKANGDEWGKYVSNSLQANVARSAMEMRTKIAWGTIAAGIAQDMSSTAFGMTLQEFMGWVSTGKLPNHPVGPKAATEPHKYQSANAAEHATRHEGGILGRGGVNKRTGYSGSKAHSEVDLRARVGEYVMSNSAVDKYGADFMDQINSGTMGQGGPQMSGIAGMMMAGVAAMMRNTIQTQMTSAGNNALSAGIPSSAFSGSPGKYGNIKLDAVQLANASKIMSVGSSMGATSRDLMIGLMTAMQESNLRNLNHGDRDSVGLFQQRPSQGWGTVAQIMTPEYAARKFFERELRVKGRESMMPTLVAQAVQRSAFPFAYAKWEEMAKAIVGGGTPMSIAPSGTGGYIRPMRTGRVSSPYGYRVDPYTGQRSYHDGIDIAAPSGTPIYASQTGFVSQAMMDGGYGNRTILDHANGQQTGYAHQSRMAVHTGQQVRQGQLIGYVGTTGRSTGNHLHFQVGRKYAWLDPRMFVPGLAKGGFTLNDGYAKLHRNETVVTAPLTEKFKQGVDNFANGGGNEYTVEVNINGNVSSDIDIKRAVRAGIEEVEKERAMRLGLKRVVK